MSIQESCAKKSPWCTTDSSRGEYWGLGYPLCFFVSTLPQVLETARSSMYPYKLILPPPVVILCAWMSTYCYKSHRGGDCQCLWMQDLIPCRYNGRGHCRVAHVWRMHTLASSSSFLLLCMTMRILFGTFLIPCTNREGLRRMQPAPLFFISPTPPLQSLSPVS